MKQARFRWNASPYRDAQPQAPMQITMITSPCKERHNQNALHLEDAIRVASEYIN